MRNSVGRLSNGISVTVGVCQGFGFEQEPFGSPFDQAVAAAQKGSIDVSRGDSASGSRVVEIVRNPNMQSSQIQIIRKERVP